MLQDEDVYTFFEPELPSESPPAPRAMVANLVMPKTSASKSGSKAARLRKQRSLSALEKKAANHGSGTAPEPILQDKTSLYEGSSVLDLKGDNYFSCAVGRKRSNARYLLGSSDDVVTLLEELAQCSSCSWLHYAYCRCSFHSEGRGMAWLFCDGCQISLYMCIMILEFE